MTSLRRHLCAIKLMFDIPINRSSNPNEVSMCMYSKSFARGYDEAMEAEVDFGNIR